jgi:hypothetical protein
MKTEKIFDFPIDSPLNAAKRKTVERQIKQNAHLSPKPVSFRWNEDDDDVLHIEAEPLLIEVRFQPKKVELFATAPLWARLLFTKQRKAELKEEIESVLQKAKFVTAKKPTPQKAKFSAARKPKTSKAKAVAVGKATGRSKR